jgi:hypothetical protein
VLDQGALVLEGVTLAEVVQLVVKVLVDLAAGTVLDEKTAEDTQTAHPQNLRRHTGVGSTLSLTVTTVATNTAGEVQLTSAGAGVHGDGLADDEAIGDQLADGLARVGVRDFALLVGVEPDLALTTADNRRGKALLSSQVDPEDKITILALYSYSHDPSRWPPLRILEVAGSHCIIEIGYAAVLSTRVCMYRRFTHILNVCCRGWPVLDCVRFRSQREGFQESKISWGWTHPHRVCGFTCTKPNFSR